MWWYGLLKLSGAGTRYLQLGDQYLEHSKHRYSVLHIMIPSNILYLGISCTHNRKLNHESLRQLTWLSRLDHPHLTQIIPIENYGNFPKICADKITLDTCNILINAHNGLCPAQGMPAKIKQWSEVAQMHTMRESRA